MHAGIDAAAVAEGALVDGAPIPYTPDAASRADDGPSGATGTGLLLVVTRTMYDQGVGLQNSPSSAHLAPPTSVRLNPADFVALGVADGATVRVATARGEVAAPALSDAGVPKGTAAMVFNQGNASAAALIDGSSRFTAVRVERP
jgi:anaerobic selenocysteine-containing dehydrogenase